MFTHEPYNPLSRRVHRRCKRCGSGDTKIVNGEDPGILYNANILTEHMSFFGAAEGKLILGINTVRGLGTDSEEQAIRRLLMG